LTDVAVSDESVVAALVMVPVELPSVVDGDEESVAVMVLPLLSVVRLSDLVSVAEVSVADDLLSVAVAVALSCVVVACAELVLSSRAAIKESRSGNHLGQGHAAVNVARSMKSNEYICRLLEVLIVK